MKNRLIIWFIFAAHGHVCAAMQLHCKYSEMSQFVCHLYLDKVDGRELRGLLEDSIFSHYSLSKFSKEELDQDKLLLFPRHPDTGTCNFLHALAQLDAIEDINKVLGAIEDPSQRQQLREKVQGIYTNYIQQRASANAVSITQLYVRDLQAYVDQHKSFITEFVDCLISFYGVVSPPYEEITIYLCPVAAGSPNSLAFYCNNSIFVTCSPAVAQQQPTCLLLGNVMHEVAHMLYENQYATLKQKIDQFFLQHPSQYAYLAYRYFDEALATALGNGVFVEALYGQHDINYTNKFIRGFAMAIYGDVGKYLNKPQEIDTAFLVQCVKRFKDHFPDASRNLHQILDRYVLFTHDLDREQVQQRLAHHFHSESVLFYPLKKPNIDEDIPYYDRNAPCIFVLSPRERENLTNLREVNPYLQRVKRSKLKKLNNGFDYYRDKHERLYLFFVAADYDELGQLIRALKQQKYL